MGSTKSYVRTVVHVRRNRKEAFQPADFDVCLMDYFGMGDEIGQIECFMDDNKVFLQLSSSSDHPASILPPLKARSSDKYYQKGSRSQQKDTSYRFQHPSFCVAHKITDEDKKTLPTDIITRGVDVGIAMLLESAEGRLLITRRAPHMRTFPGVWVPPGGHVEEGETIAEVGARELKEETGLVLEPHEYQQSRIIGLWESMYPPVLYMGRPKRHHLVIYLHLKLDRSTEELQRHLQLDYTEVDACFWMTKELAEIVVYGSHEKPNEVVLMTTVDEHGEHREAHLNPKALRKKMPEPGHEVERMTTGLRYALKLWLLDQEEAHEKQEEEKGSSRRKHKQPTPKNKYR